MESWSLPSRPLGLVFDLDSTLYTHEEYARFQNRAIIGRLARERGEDPARTEALIDARRQEIRRRGGGDVSLGGLFLSFGVSIETSARWREELIRPGEWLAEDPRLDRALERLGSRFRLAVVTNNPRSVGEAGLRALGVSGRFEFLVGLDDSLRSKPDPASFVLALRRLGLSADSCISIGDRRDIDIVPALDLGMGAILVQGVAEVYELPGLLGTGA